MTNEQTSELYNTVNNMNVVPGSHRELAQARTLRNMKEWLKSFQEKMEDIDADNCATKDVDGVKMIVKETLYRTVKKANGDEEKVPFQINTYTSEGEAARKKSIRDFMNKESIKFEVYSTTDDGELKAYQKEILKEYGFLVEEKEFKLKASKK